MKTLTICFSIIFLSSFLFTTESCSSGNQEKESAISTDIVQNPISASGEEGTGKLPKIEFDKKVHDFGLVIQGEKVSYSFRFKNSGQSDLVISGATASCGCTVPEFSKKPIKPGSGSEITVVFNSDNREGNQHKTIKVVSNCQPNVTELSITANVVVPK